jgi:hypothetical protein
MDTIPLDLERRCEQRWAARFSAARGSKSSIALKGSSSLNNSPRPTPAKEKPAG